MRITLKVYGSVQGVGFRYEAKKMADSLGLTGCARNQDDGSVYIEAEGDEGQIKKLLAWCEKGPLSAKVERAEHNLSNAVRHYERFSIE